MNADLKRDMKVLRTLAYRRVEKAGALLEALHALRTTHPDHPSQAVAEIVRRWLLTPYTLWPVDFVGIGNHVVSVIHAGGIVEPEVQFLIEEVSTLPTTKAQNTVAAHERRVEKGHYEGMLKASARLKFREKAKLVGANPMFREQWCRLKSLFDLSKFEYPKSSGLIRRSMVQERNFRRDWNFDPKDEKARFRAAFDAFCHRWNLYGMEGDNPLVLKLSVNLTAHGTMILVPAFWSFDHARDLNWSEITRLHRARGIIRQGPKLSDGRIKRQKLARRVQRAWNQLSGEGVKGEELYRQIKKKAKLPEVFTDREIRRLKREADIALSTSGMIVSGVPAPRSNERASRASRPRSADTPSLKGGNRS